jgi:hypothetical protein
MKDITDELLQHGAAKQAQSHTPPSSPGTAAPPPHFDFKSPSFFAGYNLPKDAILVGDCHMTRGDLTVIGGVPGCGKSRLLVSLAIAGKQGKGASWMGLPVHAPFKTAILQAENGEVRLKRELEDITGQGHDLEGHLFITPPPPRGFAFTDPLFCEELKKWLEIEKPGIFAIDPWNRAVSDDKARDYREALESILSCLPNGPEKPAVVIIHHLRKQGSGDVRKHGRDLLNELSGSYVIGSACRVAFILEPATPDAEDNRVVFTCAKNNNGEMGAPTAWHRQNGLFSQCEGFDWKEWNQGASKRRVIDVEDLSSVFDDGDKTLSKADAVKALKAQTGVGQSAAYDALKPDGRFSEHLSESGGFITFKP